MIYLDNAATKATLDIVKQKMKPYLNEYYGNPASNYQFAIKSKEAVEKARKDIASHINALSKEIYFTSGGTEADNWAIKNTALINQHRGKHIISSKIEHHAVLNSLNYLKSIGFNIDYARVLENGKVDVQWIKRNIRKDTILISIMMANNETGVIQPISQIGELAHNNNIVFHTDAVQTFGHEIIDCKKQHIDLLSASAHKFGGPKGVGFLYINEGCNIFPYIHGGSQERNMRGGTTNVAGVVGMGEAANCSYRHLKEWNSKIKELRDYMAARLLKEIPYTRINGDLKDRLCNNINLSFQFVNGSTLLELLDAKGICASGASACNSNVQTISHVLEAMGISEEVARGTLRLTLSEENTKEEIDTAIDIIKSSVLKLREYA